MMSGGIYDKVCGLINEWTPSKNYKSEAKYRDELLVYLREHIKERNAFGLSGLGGMGGDAHVMKERGRAVADIAVNRTEVGVELKYNLNSKSKVNHLVGQINDYMDSYNDVIVLFVGKTDKESYQYAKQQLSKLSRGNSNPMAPYQGKRMQIIDKGGVEKKKKKSTNSGFGFNFP